MLMRWRLGRRHGLRLSFTAVRPPVVSFDCFTVFSLRARALIPECTLGMHTAASSYSTPSHGSIHATLQLRDQ
jgi:hypothetical protein